MTILVCPNCRRKFDSDSTEAMPFCSSRCKLIDLGRWLNEEYRLPVDPEADEDAESSPNEEV